MSVNEANRQALRRAAQAEIERDEAERRRRADPVVSDQELRKSERRFGEVVRARAGRTSLAIEDEGQSEEELSGGTFDGGARGTEPSPPSVDEVFATALKKRLNEGRYSA